MSHKHKPVRNHIAEVIEANLNVTREKMEEYVSALDLVLPLLEDPRLGIQTILSGMGGPSVGNVCGSVYPGNDPNPNTCTTQGCGVQSCGPDDHSCSDIHHCGCYNDTSQSGVIPGDYNFNVEDWMNVLEQVSNVLKDRQMQNPHQHYSIRVSHLPRY